MKKGEKASYIFGPCTITKEEEVKDRKAGKVKKEEKRILIGFRRIPIFGYEQTEGKPLPYIASTSWAATGQQPCGQEGEKMATCGRMEET